MHQIMFLTEHMKQLASWHDYLGPEARPPTPVLALVPLNLSTTPGFIATPVDTWSSLMSLQRR